MSSSNNNNNEHVDPDAHLYESDRQLFRDRITGGESNNNNNNNEDDLLATHRRETRRLLYASDVSLYSHGADLWSSDRMLYRTKGDFDEESLRRDVERLRTESGFVFSSSSNNNNKISGETKKQHFSSECAICLTEFADGDRCIKLKCKHAYHEACIVKTLEREKRECPLCRSKEL